MNTADTKTRIAAAESALAKINAKCAELAEIERAATRELAMDPCDANAKRVKAASSDHDDWKAGRIVAERNLADARAELASQETASMAERSRHHAAQASMRNTRTRIAPHVAAIVEAARALDAALNGIDAVVMAQHEDVSRAVSYAIDAGLAEPQLSRLGGSDIGAHLLVALSRAGLQRSYLHRVLAWIPEVPSEGGDRALCTAVFHKLDLGGIREPSEMPYAEQIERALNGESIHHVNDAATAAE